LHTLRRQLNERRFPLGGKAMIVNFVEKFSFYVSIWLLLESIFPLNQIHGISIKSNITNNLNWIDVVEHQLSTKIIFDFSKNISFERRVITEKNQLLLSFPGMSLKTFDPQKVISKFAPLKKSGLIKHIKIEEKTNNSPKVILAIEFHPYRYEKNTNTKPLQQTKNQLLIKWSTLKNPNTLILEIFKKEDLEKLVKKDAIFLYAKNDVFSSGSSPPYNLHKGNEFRRDCRIIIDPGHGGSDCGAKGHGGLVEKKLTLDIAKRVCFTLKKSGVRTFLTRSIDKNVSLANRAHLAQQLKADLFVSIHVNAAANKKATGVETFYLDGNQMLSTEKQTGFLFVNLKKDLDIVYKIENRLKTLLNKSKSLANHIQDNVILLLQKKNISIKNRGIKKNKFQVFIRSGVPSALVEVGFLTNINEAKRLSQSWYRELMVQGICNGICSYLKRQ
jgi:N-acetylmuramoyl-L-alanine amidase